MGELTNRRKRVLETAFQDLSESLKNNYFIDKTYRGTDESSEESDYPVSPKNSVSDADSELSIDSFYIDKEEDEKNCTPVPATILPTNQKSEEEKDDSLGDSFYNTSSEDEKINAPVPTPILLSNKESQEKTDDILGDSFYNTSPEILENNESCVPVVAEKNVISCKNSQSIEIINESVSLTLQDPQVLQVVDALFEQIFSDNTSEVNAGNCLGSRTKKKKVTEVISSSSESVSNVSTNSNEITKLNVFDKCHSYIESIPLNNSQLSNPPIDDLLNTPKKKRISNLIEFSDTDSGSATSAKPVILLKKRNPFFKKTIFNRGLSNKKNPFTVEPSTQIENFETNMMAPSQRHLEIPVNVSEEKFTFRDILRKNTDWVSFFFFMMSRIRK